MIKTIVFDMDGTIADFYNVPNWLEYLMVEDTTPYELAQPLVRLSALAKRLNNLQRLGYRLAICSWCSKNGSVEYNKAVEQVKVKWLEKHMPSVHWDEINIIPYGTPKQNYCHSADDILFDDEIQNRNNWNGQAYAETEIFKVLAEIMGQ